MIIKKAINNYKEVKQRKHEQYFGDKASEYQEGNIKVWHKSQVTDIYHGFEDHKHK